MEIEIGGFGKGGGLLKCIYVHWTGRNNLAGTCRLSPAAAGSGDTWFDDVEGTKPEGWCDQGSVLYSSMGQNGVFFWGHIQQKAYGLIIGKFSSCSRMVQIQMDEAQPEPFLLQPLC